VKLNFIHFYILFATSFSAQRNKPQLLSNSRAHVQATLHFKSECRMRARVYGNAAARSGGPRTGGGRGRLRPTAKICATTAAE